MAYYNNLRASDGTTSERATDEIDDEALLALEIPGEQAGGADEFGEFGLSDDALLSLEY